MKIGIKCNHFMNICNYLVILGNYFLKNVTNKNNIRIYSDCFIHISKK